MTNLAAEYHKTGFLSVNAKKVGLDIQNFCDALMASIDKASLTNFPDSKGMKFTDYVDMLNNHDVEKGTNYISQLYQILPTFPCVWNFATSSILTTFIEKTCGTGQLTMGTVPLIRIDRPRNKHFQTPWHQDYWFSQSATESVVVWFPLAEMNEKIGYLKAIPRPQDYGIVPFKIYDDGHEPFEPKYEVNEELATEIPCNFGEILIFKQSLLHKSGDNMSNTSRISCQLRYNAVSMQNYVFSTFRAVHSEHVLTEQKIVLAND